jgi:hypothetical protein
MNQASLLFGVTGVRMVADWFNRMRGQCGKRQAQKADIGLAHIPEGARLNRLRFCLEQTLGAFTADSAEGTIIDCDERMK